MAAAGILRFATAGSVDDGKSSLIGRLLYDSKSILEDQLLSIEKASQQRGSGQVELALLTDGLRAEREQNITIDVAYRYFSTDKRKFIIADTPGHLQYTRNMVTGTSTADVSVILIDARKGVLSQSKRHAAISALLGIRQLVVAVNKMDLVDFSEHRFDEIAQEFSAFVAKLGIPQTEFIPISALLGDNVVEPSASMEWYSGPTLLKFLEEVEPHQKPFEELRLPIQYVIRPNQDYRGYSGRIESGALKVGDAVEVSTGSSARVQSLYVGGQAELEATAGQAVVVELDRDIDVSRGDLLYAPTSPPVVSDRIEAIVCWMTEQPLELGRRYLLLQGPTRVSATVESIVHRVDVDSLDEQPVSGLGMNDIGRIIVHTASPLHFDPYAVSPGTGSFVMVDPFTHSTVAAGMIQEAVSKSEPEIVTGKWLWLSIPIDDARSLSSELRKFGKVVVVLPNNLDDVLIKDFLQQGIHVISVGGNPMPGSVKVVIEGQDTRPLTLEAILSLL